MRASGSLAGALAPLVLSCAVSFFGDAAENCKRIEAAIRGYEARCSVALAVDFPDCDAALAGDVNASKAGDCETALVALACPTGRVALPDACRMSLVAP